VTAAEHRPEYLLNEDDGVAWVPCDEHAPARGKAKAAAYHDISWWGDWTALRCRKVWMIWDDEQIDPVSGTPGCWWECRKDYPDAVPYWRVEDRRRV
jgi:hypothetical protein